MNIAGKVAAVAVVVSLSALWASCGGDDPATAGDGDSVQSPAKSSPESTPSTSLRVSVFQFRPNTIEVKAGTVVRWVNEDEILHTVTSGSPESRLAAFDGRLDGKGTTFSFQFNEPGIYSYFCDRHQGMRGEVRVN